MATESQFLMLPGEIRNQIYNYLFILPSPSTPRQLGDPPIHSAILSTCSKIHDEGNQILYGNNTFLAHPSLLTGLPRLRHKYATVSLSHLIALIKRYHILVRLDCDPNFTKAEAQRAFSGMEEVTIEVTQAQFGSSDHKVLRLFEDVRGVQKAWIYGSVIAFPSYVEWLREGMQAEIGTARVFEDESMKDHTVRTYDIWTVSGFQVM